MPNAHDPPPYAPPPAAQPAVPAEAQRPRWRSQDLFGAHQEVEIEHGGEIYRLRRTALGKLILNK